MNKSRFLEGIIIGAVIGILGYIFYKEQEEAISPEQDQAAPSDQTQEFKSEKVGTKKKSEASVSKTLEAIEKGFDKITKIIDERKIKEKK